MLVIRLARTGRAKYPTYRIVAAESARAATGRFVEVLGHYNPHTKELVVKREETAKRLSNGAQPSNTVAKLLQRDGGVELPAWVKVKARRDTKAAAAAEASAAAEAEAAANAEVTPEEAAADADATEEVRVAGVVEDEVAATDENAAGVNDTETESTEAAVAEDAEAAQDAAAKAAGADK